MNFISSLVNTVKNLFAPQKPAVKISGFQGNYGPTNAQQSLLNNLMKLPTPPQAPTKLQTSTNNLINYNNKAIAETRAQINDPYNPANLIHNYLTSIGGLPQSSQSQAPSPYTQVAQAQAAPQSFQYTSPALPSYNMGDVSSGLSSISNLVSQLRGLQHPIFTSNANPTTINNTMSSNYLAGIPQQPSIIQKQQQYGLI